VATVVEHVSLWHRGVERCGDHPPYALNLGQTLARLIRAEHLEQFMVHHLDALIQPD
jgi:hypothetical protein